MHEQLQNSLHALAVIKNLILSSVVEAKRFQDVALSIAFLESLESSIENQIIGNNTNEKE